MILFPLNAYQKNIWISQMLNDANPLFNIGARIEIRGIVNFDTLQCAIRQTIRENEALRVRLKSEKDDINQYIVADVDFHLDFYDFSDKDYTEAYVKQWVQEQFEVPIGLDGYLFRFLLVKLDPELYYFMPKTHHIITDGAGLAQIIRRIATFYNNRDAETINGPYQKLITLNQDYNTSPQFKKDVEFWKLKFNNIPDPIFRPAGVNENTKSTRQQYNFSSAKYDRITSLTAGANCSEFHFFLALLATYFSKVYNRSEIVIGVPVLNRSKRDRTIVGHTVNIIPLCINVDKSFSFNELLLEVKSELIQCYRHSRLDYGTIHRVLGLKDRFLYDLKLSFNTFDHALNIEDTSSFTYALSHGREQQALFLEVYDGARKEDEDVILNFDYQSYIFNESMPVENLINHLENIIDQVLADPARKIDQLTVLNESERQILASFNDNTLPYPVDKTIVHQFEEQVNNCPEEVAVIFQDSNINYRDLNELSNQWADHLISNYNIEPDDLVGVQLDRTPQMIAVILGILKAGGAYVPIDPAYPEKRIAYIIKNSKCKVVIDEDEAASFTMQQQRYKKYNPGIRINPSSLSHVIYTSGSTGVPKGVAIAHKNLAALMAWCGEEFTTDRFNLVYASTSICFDMSVFEILYTLSAGSTLRLLRNALEIRQYLDKDQGVLINTVPGVVRELLLAGEAFNTVSVLKMGGEPIGMDIVEKLPLSTLDVVNMYGPTEDTTYSSFYTIETKEPPLIGKPIANTSIYIVNDNHELQPIGVPGELLIAGDGLARGYLYDKTRSDAKFIANPFEKSGRAYITGDLGRWLPNGNIEYLGRKDNQIKVRGFRVELGEVEAALQKYPKLNDIAVNVVSGSKGDKEIVAYLVSNDQLDANKIRAYLAEIIPGYMIPAYLIQLEALPKLPNGKLNKNALPDPMEGGLLGVSTVENIEVSEADQLAPLWAEVLEIDERSVGAHHNFFDLGGHSLKAIRLIAMINHAFGVNLKTGDLFNYPTINALGKFMQLNRSGIAVEETIASSPEQLSYPNGNPDKNALPNPMEAGLLGVSPAEDIEFTQANQLVSLWAEALEIDEKSAGFHHNFFDLGGHSLKAIRLIAMINHAFGVNLKTDHLFKHPTINALGKFMQLNHSEIAVKEVITFYPEQLSYPLSPAQRQMWVLSQVPEASLAYHMPGAFHIKGSVDTNALEQSFNHLLNRHEILRTVYKASPDGQIRQHVLAPKGDFRIAIIKSEPGIDQETALKSGIEAIVAAPFDLSRGPLLRAHIFQLSEHEHILLICLHHIVADGWSVELLLKEVFEGYKTIFDGEPYVAKKLKTQYKDYVHRQDSLANQESMKESKAFWFQKFADKPPILNLPADNPRPLIKTYSGSKVSGSLDPETFKALKSITSAENCTTFIALLAGVKCLLFKYTGQEDIVVGSPISVRNDIDLIDQIGLCLNTLALRNEILGTNHFIDILAKIRKITLEAYEHKLYPFDLLVDALDIEVDLSRSPLFDVMVVFNQSSFIQEGMSIGEAIVETYTIDFKTSKFDLLFDFIERDGKLLFNLEYNNHIYAERQMIQFARHFEQLMNLLTSNSTEPLQSLDIMPEEEKRIIIEKFNDTRVDFSYDKTITDLFEKQARENPENPAVCFENQRLNYAELNKTGNQIGNFLIKEYKVQPGDRVGIKLERSHHVVASIIGVLKTGACYVPIDTDLPDNRIAFMVENSDCKLVIDREVIVKFQAQKNKYSSQNISRKPSPGDLAYIIYTSGSTGEPKGIMMPHRSMVNLIEYHYSGLPVTGSRVLQFTSFSFDVSFQEIFYTLLAGKELYIVDREQRVDVIKLMQFIDDQKIDVLFLPTAYLKHMMRTLHDDDTIPKSVKHIITAGERLVLTAKFIEILNRGEITLHNHYGPAETHVVTTLTLASPIDTNLVLPGIGKPIANSQVHILDKNLKPVPIGVVGEIHLGGVCLSKGYVNNPGLTSEKFIDNPLSKGTKLYKTGDLGAWSFTGNLTFHGRADDQVKILGYRIELKEIETVLQNHPGIRSALLIAREKSLGEKELVAYIISNNSLNEPEIISFLDKRLPSYMIPAYIVPVDRFPLTVNGKINNDKLPDPGKFSILSQETFCAAETHTELQLVELWSEILNLAPDTISTHNNFFQIGGNSLKATLLTSLIRQRLDINIPLKECFKNPTISALGKLIEQLGVDPFKHIPKAPENSNYPLSSSQKRLYILSQFEEGNKAYSMPGAIKLTGTFHPEKFKQAYRLVIDKHEVLRTVFIENEYDEPRQVIRQSSDLYSKVQFEDWSANAHDQKWVEAELLKLRNIPFNLGQGPLIKSTIYQLAKEEHIVYFNIHHIVTDGWSIDVFLKDLASVYNTLLIGNITKINSLRIQYKDYTIWQNNHLEEVYMRPHMEYWLEQFRQLPPVLEILSDNPRPALQTFNGATIKGVFPADLSAALEHMVMSQGVTLFMGLLSLVKILLYRYSNQTDVVIGVPVAGRPHADLRDQIGFYVNTLPLRTQIDGNFSFIDYLNIIKKTALDAFEHQIYPFDELVGKLNLKRDTSRSALFDVMVAMQEKKQVFDGISFEGVQIEQLEMEDAGSRFDIVFNFYHKNDEIGFDIQYNTDIYAASRMERMQLHLIQLAYAATKNLKLKINELAYIDEQEKQLLLEEFSGASIPYPVHKTVPELFEKQVKLRADKLALVFEDNRLTYAQLNELSNRFADFLRTTYNIQPDDLVGIQLERSEWMIIAILGIVKSGGAYLPIDSEYPPERISYILNDSKCKILVNQSVLEGFIASKGLYSKKNQKTKLSHKHLVYAIYTSGSTGRPKGILLEHAGLVNHIHNVKHYYNVSHNSRFLQFFNIGFDAAAQEIFTCLLFGGTLYVRNNNQLDPEQTLRLIEEHKITHADFPTAYFENFLSTCNFSGKHKLQTCGIGGEKVSKRFLKNSWKEINQITNTLFNVYGPTETTLTATIFDILGDQSHADSPELPIGKPYPNRSVVILDQNHQLVPIGIPGELCIAGAGLARGYLNREQLTREKFIPHPFKKGEQLYKTGDLAYWLPDGNISFIGRTDDQVKVRGFRVEPSEITKYLLTATGVTNAVVTAIDTPGAEKDLVAYLVSDLTLVEKDLRNHLLRHLPAYMVPAHFVRLQELPLTANGKVDKNALPHPQNLDIETGVEYIAPRNETEKQLLTIWKELLKRDHIGVTDTFFEVGGNSLSIIRLKSRIKNFFNSDISVAMMFQLTTVESQAGYISGQPVNGQLPQPQLQAKAPHRKTQKESENTDIAVIGMAIKAPGAGNINEFWENLSQGKESITFFSEEELREAGIEEALLSDPNYIKANAFIEDKEYFDATFFGYSPREAKVMDPQIRVFHEAVWEALENAGCDPNEYPGLIGLFAGASANLNWQNYASIINREEVNPFALSQFSNKEFISSLVSHKLNLKGPAICVSTGCSTSLVAIHTACGSLLSNECNMAIAGGATIRMHKAGGYLYQEGMIMSSDGHCRTFDEKADGTIGGDGVGVVILKKLDQALKDGDNVWAVIKGSAINNDGKRKVGYTAPSVEGQTEVITKAHFNAGVAPSTISYVEAHGTATKLGDPIELEALKQAFGSVEKQYCAIGALKSNIGHLDSASGVAGFIKTVLSLHHKKLVPSLHFDRPNPDIDFDESPFFVNTTLKDWEVSGSPLRAGVSSFGIGGTNVHVILEEAPASEITSKSALPQLLTLSAKTAKALDSSQASLKQYLENNGDVHLPDVAWTLQTGRAHFRYRRTFVCKHIEDATEALSASRKNAMNTTSYNASRKKVAFMFPGGGSQYVNMGKGLYENEPVFKAEMEKCLAIAQKITGKNYKAILYPEASAKPSQVIDDAEYFQAILFGFEYSLVKLLGHYGINPDVMIGHSLGEYVAACISSVITLEDALRLVILRGELSTDMPEGAMMGVSLSAKELEALIPETISFAAINAPKQTVVAGNADDIDKLSLALEAKGHNTRKLHISKAFHSQMVDAVLENFQEVVSEINFGAPQIPYYSNVKGTIATQLDIEQPDYWSEHFRGTVKFSEGIQHLLNSDNLILIEAGPGRTLSSFANQHITAKEKPATINLVRHPHEEVTDREYFLGSIGKLWQNGVSPNWSALHHESVPRKIILPNYPFEKISYPLGADVSKIYSSGQNGVALQSIINSYNDSLSKVELERPELSTDYHTPDSDTERELCQIYQDHFGIDKIGVSDDFFELGGDSLKAMTLLGYVNKKFDVYIRVPQFFKRTTIIDLAHYIDNDVDKSVNIIKKVDPQENYPISSYQKKLWLFSQIEESNIAYNIPVVYELQGAFDRELFDDSISKVIDRHEILRTVFTEENQEIYQVIKSEKDFGFKVDYINLSQQLCSPEELHRKFQNLIVKAFDLDNGPLINATVFKLSENSHYFFFNMHHIISDALSIRVFFYDLMKTYDNLQAGNGKEQDPLAVQFKDYSSWLQQQLTNDQSSQHRNYWLDQFSGNLPVLEIPTEKKRPPIKTYRGARVKGTLDVPTTAALHNLVKTGGGTMFMGLTAAVNALLFRYTGETDIIMGTPISLRYHADLEKQIGFYLNTLAIRTQFEGDWSFRQLFDVVKKVTLDAYDHQIYPFDDLIDQLEIKRDISRSVLFDIMVIFQNVDNFSEGLTMGNLDMRNYETDHVTSKFDLTYIFNYHESEKQIYYYLEYNTDVFSNGEMVRMSEQLNELVKSVVSDGNVKINEVAFLGETQEKQLLELFNDTAIDYPTDKTIVDIFEAQAMQSMTETAVVFGDSRLSYNELNQKANQFAHYLKANGVAPGDIIGLFMNRSLDMMVGLLGIMKAGAAYLPLDPQYPQDRLSYLVRDSGIQIIITQDSLEHVNLEFEGKKIVIPEKLNTSTERLAHNLGPDNFVYVIYTSGSTGQPKGIPVTHGNLLNFLKGMDKAIDTEVENPTMLAVTTISFDISVLELFWTLANGFKVVIRPDQIVPSRPEKAISGVKKMDFSLFYFANSIENVDKYKLLLEGAKFADQNGFSAVWTPERHFHEFGGNYPNPAVTGASIATITKNIQIRSGSCVLPLHNPITIAEEWSVVDNLSNGRVGLSFASGWFLKDFLALAPDNFENRHKIMYEGIETIRQLWNGGKTEVLNPRGSKEFLEIFPKPVQKNLPFWVTSAGNPDTFRSAGEIGANLLTHLLGQRIDDLKEKIRLYRESWKKAGHPGKGHISLMIHTFVGDNLKEVEQSVKEPFKNYLRSSLGIIKNFAKSLGHDISEDKFTEEDMDMLLEQAFQRYFQTASLFGTPDSCLELVNELREIGVDELACLVDFGIDTATTISGFDHLNTLKALYHEHEDSHATVTTEKAEEVIQSDISLTEQIKKHEVTHIQCTPSLMQIMLSEPGARENMRSLSTILLGGEALSQQLVETLNGIVSAKIMNMYGPTETTIWSTTSLVDPGKNITIGKPIANTKIYILDTTSQLVPIGVPGELFIGGSGVTKGYLHRDELTKERFIPNPFTPGEMLYKTGDIAKWQDTGEILFLGRNDNQVKIRGYRIELGEIEAALKAFPGINAAVVHTISREDDQKDLVGYIVSDSGFSIRKLRSHLGKTLPKYMIPAYFIHMEEIPLTNNGKVNRKALPNPYNSPIDSQMTYVAPKNKEEKILVGVCKNVLKQGDIGVKENFYELGGDSIKSIQVIAQIHEQGYSLKMRDLLTHPVLEDLATKMILKVRHADQSAVVGNVPFSIFQRYFFDNPKIITRHHYNMTVTLKSRFDLSEDGLKLCFDQLTSHHDAFRMLYTKDDNNEWIQYGTPHNFNHYTLQSYDFRTYENGITKMGEECEALQINFDLAKGPLLRVGLFKLKDGDRLVIVAHHLVIDGVSWRILTEDLTTLYHQFLAGHKMELGLKTDSFSAWTHALADYAGNEKLQQEKIYWEQVLNSQPTDFPRDFPENGHNTTSQQNVSFKLTTELTKQLQTRISKFHQVEINDVLLVSLGFAIREVFKQEKTAVFIEGHGREEVFDDLDVSRTIGWFTSIIPFVMDLSEETDLSAGLLKIKQNLRAIPDKGIGYGVLRYLGEGFSRKFEPDLTFNYLGDFGSATHDEGDLFHHTKEYHGNTVGLNFNTDSPVDVAGIIYAEELTMSINYSANVYKDSNMRRFAEVFQKYLENYIHKLSSEVEEVNLNTM